MFKNIYYDRRKSTIHLWEQIKGRDFYDCIEWAPYVFLPGGDGDIKSIYGEPMVRRDFNTYYEYKAFVDANVCHENLVKPEIAFLTERYAGIPDDNIEIPDLKVYSIDIETYAETFSSPQEANDPITLISVWNMEKWQGVGFGVKPYTGEAENYTYIECQDEKTLLTRFLAWVKKYSPDVWTGWNIYWFDFPVIINRIKKIFGEDTTLFNLLSPVNAVSMWTGARSFDGSGKFMKGSEYKLDIGGVTILDMMDVYKRYGQKAESYSLDFVSSLELEKGKLDYSKDASSLRTLQLNNWNTFVEYNIVDTKRPLQLEDKLGYIKMIQTLSLVTKTPMYCYQTQNAQIEGAMLTYFRRKGLCAPPLSKGTKEDYEAAYVKEPVTGLHKWVVDIDVLSEYPTAIITLNMSPETYFGKILNLSEQEVVKYTRKREFPEINVRKKDDSVIRYDESKVSIFNRALRAGRFTVAPNGAVFTTDKVGCIADVEYQLFQQRKKFKKKMKATVDKVAVDKLDKLQYTTKILLNSIYGIMAIPYSRYANVNIAEAITACGRHIVRSGESFVNEILNKPGKELRAILEELK